MYDWHDSASATNGTINSSGTLRTYLEDREENRLARSSTHHSRFSTYIASVLSNSVNLLDEGL